jgi:ComEC/Rec2-related protein
MGHTFRGQGGLFLLLLFFLAGLLLGLGAGPASAGAAAFLLTTCVALVAARARATSIACAVMALCGALTAARIPLLPLETVRPYLESQVALEGTVDEVRATDGGWSGAVKGAVVSAPHSARSLALGTVLLHLRNPDLPVSFPARVRAAGRLYPMLGSGNPGEMPRVWGAMAAGAQYALSAEASSAVFLPIRETGGTAEFFARARRRTGEWVRRHAGTSDGALYLLSLATGEVPPGSHPMVALLRRTGLAHLLAISGINVAIFHVLLLCLLRLLFWIPGRRRGAPDLNFLPALLSLPACWGYVLLAGSPAPAVRSAGMITLSVLLWRRLGLRAPSAAWTGMFFLALVVSPLELFSPSFLLSYGATFYLIANCDLRPQEDGVRWGTRAARWAREAAKASAVAFLGTLPISAAFFRSVPAGAVVWNVLFGPVLGTAGVAGASLAVLGGAFGADTAGPPVRYAANGLSAALSLLDTLSGSGAGCFTIPPSGPAAMCLFTAAGVSGTLFLLRSGRKPWPAAAAAAALFLGWIHLPYAALPDNVFSLTALNVGKGSAQLASFPGGGRMLIDCGGALRGDAGNRVVLPFLRGRGVRRIDILCLTHPHEDHYGGAQAILSALSVGEIWIPEGVPREAFGPAVAAWPGTVRAVRRGEGRRMGGGEILVRSPRSRKRPARANDGGIVLELRFGILSVWLPGDTEEGPSAWGLPVAGAAERGVLFLPHHGSKGANPGGWEALCRPLAVVAQNRHCFTGGNLLPSAQHFLLENGAVTVHSDGKNASFCQQYRYGLWERLWQLI